MMFKNLSKKKVGLSLTKFLPEYSTDLRLKFGKKTKDAHEIFYFNRCFIEPPLTIDLGKIKKI